LIFKKLAVAAIMMAAVGGLAGCSSGGANAGANRDSSYRIAFSFGQSQHPFFVAMQKGAEDAAKKLGVQLTASSADFKVENQVDIIENELQKNVDAILVNPIDSEALATTVAQATTQGVPVFAVDINVVGADVTSFVSSDNTEIGKIAAEDIIKHLGGKGNVAILGWPTISSTRDRQAGFEEAMKEAPGIRIVATSGDAMERTAALDAAENILQSNPELNAIFGVNEAGALGALGAVDAQGSSDVYIVGVDATPDLLKAVQGGTAVQAAVAQDPYQMGKAAVELAVKHLNGEKVKKTVSVPIDLVTKDNVQKFIDREAAYAK
jgi:ribose transport system substrate-binding protein